MFVNPNEAVKGVSVRVAVGVDGIFPEIRTHDGENISLRGFFMLPSKLFKPLLY
jgi:hypothetical protein